MHNFPFGQENVKNYLDTCINLWREERARGSGVARYYVDAYQSVRTMLFGDVLADRYPMCKDQPVQLDCREVGCLFHKDGRCVNASPAITLGPNKTFACWTSQASVPGG